MSLRLQRRWTIRRSQHCRRTSSANQPLIHRRLWNSRAAINHRDSSPPRAPQVFITPSAFTFDFYTRTEGDKHGVAGCHGAGCSLMCPSSAASVTSGSPSLNQPPPPPGLPVCLSVSPSLLALPPVSPFSHFRSSAVQQSKKKCWVRRHTADFGSPPSNSDSTPSLRPPEVICTAAGLTTLNSSTAAWSYNTE